MGVDETDTVDINAAGIDIDPQHLIAIPGGVHFHGFPNSIHPCSVLKWWYADHPINGKSGPETIDFHHEIWCCPVFQRETKPLIQVIRSTGKPCIS